MAFDFPNSPTLGQAYGNYLWDGEKWTLPNLVDPVAARKSVYAAPFDAMAYSGMQINGSMEVTQEKGSTATTVSGQYICDGWLLGAGGTAVVSASIIGSRAQFPGIPSFLNVAVTTAQASMGAGDAFGVTQRVEGYRVERLAWGLASAQPITIGFWTAHHRTGTYSVAIRGSGVTASYVATYTQDVADTAEYKTITVPGIITLAWNIANTASFAITFALAVGATNTTPAVSVWETSYGNYQAGTGQVNAVAATSDVFRLTGVVVLPGTEAPSAARSPLIMRPYDQELVTCMRYFRFKGYGMQGQAEGVSQLMFSYSNDTPLRATPTVTPLLASINVRRYSNATDLTLTLVNNIDMAATVNGGRYMWSFSGSVTLGERFHTQNDQILKLDARL